MAGTKQWPKDIRNCLIDHMSISDILKLARTAKHWKGVICSPTYNDYWKGRYFRDHFNHPFNGQVPKFVKVKEQTKTVSEPQAKKPKASLLDFPVLWFDIYQYTTERSKGGNKCALGRKTLRTFIE